MAAKAKKKRDRSQYAWFRNNPSIENMILALKQQGKEDKVAYAIARSVYNKRKAKRTVGQLNKKLTSDAERLARYKERIKQARKTAAKKKSPRRATLQ